MLEFHLEIAFHPVNLTTKIHPQWRQKCIVQLGFRQLYIDSIMGPDKENNDMLSSKERKFCCLKNAYP